jgi:hypothetical protein
VYVFLQRDITYILALYVDDTILTGPIGDFITRFKLAFGSRFDVQDLGPVAWLLNTTVIRDHSARTITSGQRQYLLDILERFNLGECNCFTTPLAKGGTDSDGTSVIQSDVPYNSLIGNLQYAAITTKAGYQHDSVPLKSLPDTAHHQALGGRQESVALFEGHH